MDSAADGLLALSSTAVAIAEQPDAMDDDRSSSLSELEDGIDNPELDATPANNTVDGDSEAETERLEESPDKIGKRMFQISPSKLSTTMTAERPEIEALTNSDVSSPMTPVEDSEVEDEASENEEDAAQEALNVLSQVATNKRKRLSDGMEVAEAARIRRRRTGSPDSDEDKSDAESEALEIPSREATVEPDEQDGRMESDKDEDEDAVEPEQEQAESSDASKSKKTVQTTRSRTRRGRSAAEAEVPEGEEDNDIVDASDEEVEVEDVEATAKSEEEQARRAAAMEALTALERHFATLRDKLYDERIAQINHELAQLAEQEPCHPELLRQIECVHRYRDEKMDVEQKLLVFKVGSLKTKSVAERAQINSAYFQTVRDTREQHLERISEHFYRIQKERFKSSTVTPTYTIPFPEKRPQQITQQAAYNKEISILSGVAKYVGFPAAPELPSVPSRELDGDMDKMGIVVQPNRLSRLTQRQTHSSFNNVISAPAAGEQFLEQTPWANPNHPIHRLNRQNSNRSPLPESYMTPSNPQKTLDPNHTASSAATIVENPSAAASSAINTPYDLNSTTKADTVPIHPHLQIYRPQSSSPSESRKAFSAGLSQHRPASQPGDMPGSSPLQARAPHDPLRRTGSAQPDVQQRGIGVGGANQTGFG